MKSNLWKGILAALAIFVLGCAFGGTVAVVAGARIIRHRLQMPVTERGLADRLVEQLGADLSRELALDARESDKVRVVLQQSALNMKKLRLQLTEGAARELDDCAARLAAALPPEKHARLYQMLAKRYQRLGVHAPQAHEAGAGETSK